METARDRAAALAGDDPVAAAVAAYLAEHVEEERHGDGGYGAGTLTDLAVLGVDHETARARPIPDPIAALAGLHYVWIVHRHPVALLGSLAVTEGFPPTEAVVERLIERTGLPRAAFAQLLEHAVLDQKHRDDLHAVIDALPLSAEHEALMGVSALETVRLLADAFAAVLAAIPQPAFA